MQAHLKCKLRLLALAFVTSLRDVTLNVGSFLKYIRTDALPADNPAVRPHSERRALPE